MMKRAGGLFDRLASFENLCAAFVAARRGKRKTDELAAFQLAAERMDGRFGRFMADLPRSTWCVPRPTAP